MLQAPPRRLSPRPSSPSNDTDSWGVPNDIASRNDGIAHQRDDASLRRRPSSRQDHPLGGEEHGNQSPPDSRPSLRRFTSETERQVAESSRSGSERGSLDFLRMSSGEVSSGAGNEEVEVLIHHVKPAESLAGIALLYGTDLATIRKINKLWPSDPVHLRTHLYVPLEACLWNNASETLVRGPGEGQVTLVPKAASRKSKGKEVDRHGETPQRDLNDDDTAARTFMPSTNAIYDRNSLDILRPDTIEDDEPTPRVLDVVRIPTSQLRFFPKSHRTPDAMPRHSLEHDRKSSSHHARRRSSADGPSIQNNLRTLPRPLQPSKPPLPPVKHNIVRLRPPSAPKPLVSSNPLANRLSSLFVVPPPPHITPSRLSLDSRPRLSMESARSSNASSPARTTIVQPEVLLEMHTRSSLDTPKWTPVDEGRKSR